MPDITKGIQDTRNMHRLKNRLEEYSLVGYSNLFLIKLDLNLNINWIMALSSADCLPLLLSQDDSCFLAGKYQNDLTIIKDNMNNEIVFSNNFDQADGSFILKVSQDGNLIWATMIGPTEYSLIDLDYDLCGNIMFTGKLDVDNQLPIRDQSFYGSNGSIYINEIDQNGKIQNYDSIIVRDINNSKIDNIAIAVDDCSEIFVGVEFRGTIEIDGESINSKQGSFDIFLKHNTI
jgi:hypothetical protein